MPIVEGSRIGGGAGDNCGQNHRHNDSIETVLDMHPDLIYFLFFGFEGGKLGNIVGVKDMSWWDGNS